MDVKSKLTNIKGRDYLEVKWRIVWFREEHPTGGIITEQAVLTDSMAVMKATVKDENGAVLGTGHGWADKKSATMGRYVEKAETAAIGRALGAAGYGTQFAGDEFDEGDYLADSPVERAPKKPAAEVLYGEDEPQPKQPEQQSAPPWSGKKPQGKLSAKQFIDAELAKTAANAGKAAAGAVPIVDTQKQATAIALKALFPDDNARHIFMDAVIGKDSITKLTMGESWALIAWARNPEADRQKEDALAEIGLPDLDE